LQIVEWNVVVVFCGDVFLDPILEKLEMMTKSRIHNPIGPKLNVLGLGSSFLVGNEEQRISMFWVWWKYFHYQGKKHYEVMRFMLLHDKDDICQWTRG
jgi:hypothetical protein